MSVGYCQRVFIWIVENAQTLKKVATKIASFIKVIRKERTMSRDKQIEEMAKAIHINCHKGLTEDESKMIAKWCYQEIDRVSLKNAREIFEEIEKVFGVDLWLGSTPWKYADYERLKKKYTEKVK